jgi:hypothetical protein
MPEYKCYLVNPDYLPRVVTTDTPADAARAAAMQVSMAGRWIVVLAADAAEFDVSERRVYDVTRIGYATGAQE